MLQMGIESNETWEGCEMVRQLAQLDVALADALTHSGAMWELLRLVIAGTRHLRSRLGSSLSSSRTGSLDVHGVPPAGPLPVHTRNSQSTGGSASEEARGTFDSKFDSKFEMPCSDAPAYGPALGGECGSDSAGEGALDRAGNGARCYTILANGLQLLPRR